MKQFSLLEVLTTTILIIIGLWLIIQLTGCGQYRQKDNIDDRYDDSSEHIQRCFDINEEACIIYGDDMLCGHIV